MKEFVRTTKKIKDERHSKQYRSCSCPGTCLFNVGKLMPSVCNIELNGCTLGTGFRIGCHFVMTANHVLEFCIGKLSLMSIFGFLVNIYQVFVCKPKDCALKRNKKFKEEDKQREVLREKEKWISDDRQSQDLERHRQAQISEKKDIIMYQEEKEEKYQRFGGSSLAWPRTELEEIQSQDNTVIIASEIPGEGRTREKSKKFRKSTLENQTAMKEKSDKNLVNHIECNITDDCDSKSNQKKTKKKKTKGKKTKRRKRDPMEKENQALLGRSEMEKFDEKALSSTRSKPVTLSSSVIVEDKIEAPLQNKIRKKFLIERKCQDDSDLVEKRSKFDKDLSWLTRTVRAFEPNILVYFNEVENLPRYNTVELILSRYFSPNPPTKKETMAYELLRLCTLHDFPKSTGQSCIRLAQAGFYYEGKDDEVTCFSCSVQVCGWQPKDIPLDRHRRSSVSCFFIDDQKSGNVHISEGTPRPDMQAVASQASGQAETVSSTANFVQITNKDITGSNSDSGFETGSVSAQSSHSSKQQKSGSRSSGYSSQSSDLYSKSRTSSQPSDSRNSSQPSTASSATPISSNTDTQSTTQYSVTTTRNVNRAVYPEYVLVNDRLQSFNRGWPDHVRQTPQMMIESGFFFAGYEDCVRCFQCGIGLRNWEPPDNPHVEHARWSPKCPFLLGVKGQDFINLVLDAVAQLAVTNEQNTSSSPSNTETNPNKAALLHTSQQAQPRSTASTASRNSAGSEARPQAAANTTTQTTAKDTATKDTGTLQSKTEHDKKVLEHAKNALKRGYSETEIKKAIENIVKKEGWENLTEEKVLKVIQEDQSRRSRNSTGLKGGNSSQNTTLPPDIVELKKKNREMREMTICKICLEEEVSIVFLPCGHLVACAQCAPALSRCAVCRKPITGTICAHLDV